MLYVTTKSLHLPDYFLSKEKYLIHSSNTMKKHLFRTLVFICGLTLFSSCMKNDPANNKTVYYGYQQIPNINEYMPQRLLEAFGQNHLYFGDEPPKIEGKYLVDGFYFESSVKIDTLWQPRTGLLPVKEYYHFYNQHKGIATYTLQRPYIDANTGHLQFLENSSNDSTVSIISTNDRFDAFVNDTIAPSYFKNENAKYMDFNNIYIMGNDPYFTAYFYELRNISSNTQPLHAVIMSGKMAEEIVVRTDTVHNTTDTIKMPVIQDFRIGYQTMYYYNKSSILYNALINNGSLPLPGNVWIMKSVGDLHYGEFN